MIGNMSKQTGILGKITPVKTTNINNVENKLKSVAKLLSENKIKEATDIIETIDSNISAYFDVSLISNLATTEHIHYFANNYLRYLSVSDIVFLLANNKIDPANRRIIFRLKQFNDTTKVFSEVQRYDDQRFFIEFLEENKSSTISWLDNNNGWREYGLWSFANLYEKKM